MTSVKTASGEYKKQWHKYLPIAILHYNTTYHSSIDCEPSRVFHGRFPHKIPDHKLGLRFSPNTAPTTDFAGLRRRITPQNQNPIRQNQEKCHAIFNRIQKLLRLKSQSFTIKRERLLLHTAAKSGPPRVKNTTS